MTEKTQPASAPAAPVAPPAAKIKVQVVQQPVLQDGIYYLKGQSLEVTAERAAELGEQVRPVPEPEKEKATK
jgi:hypothetical protein